MLTLNVKNIEIIVAKDTISVNYYYTDFKRFALFLNKNTC